MCDSVPEGACREAPRNFILNALNGFSTKLAEQLVSPGVVLPWLFSTLGIPYTFTSFLIPVKNAGSLLPQLFVSAKIRSFALRKYFWTTAGLIQGCIWLLLALILHEYRGAMAGYIVLTALLVFSVGSGVGSIAFKDVMAKTIPEGKRGRLLATRATGGGILTLLAGLYFYFGRLGQESTDTFLLLMVVGGFLWIFAAVIFGFTKEEKGSTEGGRDLISEVKNGASILAKDKNFALFLSTRVLLMAIPLAQPFIVVFGREHLDAGMEDLGLFVLISGISAAISSPFWGRFSDRSSKKMMQFVALFGVVIILYVLSFPLWPATFQTIYAFSPAFFLISMAHGGARLSRKTYLVDYAPEQERPLYVAVANTTIGAFTILSGGIGLIAKMFSLQILFVFLALCLCAAALLGHRLTKV